MFMIAGLAAIPFSSKHIAIVSSKLTLGKASTTKTNSAVTKQEPSFSILA